jgi:hypothetical protein
MEQDLKRYRTTYSFDARNEREMSIRVGDMVIVRRKANGEWPNDQRWMEGRNERTGKQGEIPGNYLEFVEIVQPSSSPSPISRKRIVQLTRDPVISPSKAPPKPKPRPGSVYNNKSTSNAPPVAARNRRSAEDNRQQNPQAPPLTVSVRGTGNEAVGEPSAPQPPPRLVKAASPGAFAVSRRQTTGDIHPRPSSAPGQRRLESSTDGDCPPPPPRRRDTPSFKDPDTSLSLSTSESRPPPVAPRVSSKRVEEDAEIADSTAEHDLFEAHFPKPTYCKHCDCFIWGHGKTGLKCSSIPVFEMTWCF